MADWKISDDIYQEIVQEAKDKNLNLEETVDQLIQWINKEPHLPDYMDNRKKLIHFLYAKKFSLEKTKQVIDNYYTFRRLVPEFFENRDPLSKRNKAMLDSIHFAAFPEPVDGYRVLYTANHTVNFDTVIPEDFSKCVFAAIEMYLMRDYAKGVILVINLVNFQPKIIPIAALKKTFLTAAKCYPMRIKRVYFLNTPSILYNILNVVQHFIPEKLVQRLQMYKAEDDLSQFASDIGLKNCPKELGGESEITIAEMDAHFRKEFYKTRDWFLREENRMTDEKKRTCKAIYNTDQLFGLDGSFRQLTID